MTKQEKIKKLNELIGWCRSQQDLWRADLSQPPSFNSLCIKKYENLIKASENLIKMYDKGSE